MELEKFITESLVSINNALKKASKETGEAYFFKND